MYSPHRWEDKGVHNFPKVICQKVNVIAWLEFELAYYDSAVQFLNHDTPGLLCVGLKLNSSNLVKYFSHLLMSA